MAIDNFEDFFSVNFRSIVSAPYRLRMLNDEEARCLDVSVWDDVYITMANYMIENNRI